MEIRDAVEADAEALSAIADSPTDVMRNLVHDRTVRVAEAGTADDPNADVSVPDPSLLGFISFDAREETVYITQIGGTKEACEALLGEPIRFARSERLTVEVMIDAEADHVREAIESVGFEERGSGPQFDGSQMVRYHLDPFPTV